MTGKDDLCKALSQFRKDWAPKVITQPCMHYNYASLKHAFEVFYREWSNLCTASKDNYAKTYLVWRQLIGFEMRRLPGIDRCVMAQGLYYVIQHNAPVDRSYTLKKGKVSCRTFPITLEDDSIDGLGGVFSINVFGGRMAGHVNTGMWRGAIDIWELMSKKNLKLAQLMRQDPTYQPSQCVLL